MFRKNKSSAKVVEGKLLLSFPRAVTPVIWQMDLSEVSAASFEVVAKKENFALTLKPATGTKQDVAVFSTHDEALSALLAAFKALENAHGQMRGRVANTDHANVVYTASGRGVWKKWVGGIAAVIVLFFVFGIWNANQQLRQIDAGQVSVAGNSQQGGSAANSAGVPVSADDFLSGL